MASSARALVARLVTQIVGEVTPARAPSPPVAPAGYRALEPKRAGDYLAPAARWPLVWITDIAGWTPEPVTRQVSFTLTHGARYTSESARFQCTLPADEADLYDPKHGRYIVIHLPVENEAQVAAILAAARGSAAR